jgi:pheromone shutdown protein TraB
MVLTTIDIGTKPEEVEANLSRRFKTAQSWNAVVLIDEADVFVANRTIKDLHRSSLVASMPIV